MNQSALLSYLLERAVQLGCRVKNQKTTADYFMAAVLEVLAAKQAGTLPSALEAEAPMGELCAMETMLAPYALNYTAAKESLVADADGKDEGLVSNRVLAFDLRLQAASAMQKQQGGAEVTAVYILENVLKTPTDSIEACVLSGKKGAAEEKSEKKDPYSFLASGTSADLSSLFGGGGKKEESSAPGAASPAETAESKSAAAATSKEASAADPNDLPGIVAKTGDIQKTLLDNVYGQDFAIDTFVSGYFQTRLAGLSDKKDRKPQATFLFAGPPGVGKTFLAEKVADALQIPFMRFDMSEYSDGEMGPVQFRGSDGVYRGSKAGNVTGFVNQNPHSVLLFDEIEKAHVNVIYLFLQLLDAGHLRDGYLNKEVSFSDTIVILTTNAGKNLYGDTSITNLSTLPRKKIIGALSTDKKPGTNMPLFPEAICSRFASGNVVMFNRLGANDLHFIVKRQLDQNVENFEKSTGIRLELDPRIPTVLIQTEGGNADARTVKGRANSFFNQELYELFRLMASDREAFSKLKSIRVNIHLEDAPEEAKRLIVNTRPTEVLLFADRGKFDVEKILPHVTCHVADSIAEAKEILFNHDISLILCDIFCGLKDGAELLNVEDISSVGHDFMYYALSRYSVPVYAVEQTKGQIRSEEFLSLAKAGVADVLTVAGGRKNHFEAAVLYAAEVAYQQSNMLKLARENKVMSFKTSQSVTKNKKAAEIRLFDFRLTISTDTDDAKGILDNVSRPELLFEDVIGATDAKGELSYFVEYLKDPVKYMRQGVRAPRGVLLYGPPGTGKTMLAKAMAGESNVTFLAAEGNQFLQHYVGDGPEAVHNLFKTARKYAPAIIFIDEIDAIGKDRALDEAKNSADTLTALFTEMDGFHTDTTKPVFVLAATNFEVDSSKGRALDPALLRRFDRRIFVDLPTKEERKQFLRMKVKKNPMFTLSEEQIDNIALRSTGMSLAELDNVFEMALRGAIRQKDCKVTDAAFDEAFETAQGGEKKTWSESSLLRTARHEAGHALLGYLGGRRISYLTVVSRGDHGGYMQHTDAEEKGSYTKEDLLTLIRTSLGGRGAELVYYGEQDGVSTGASGDLGHATHLAESMIGAYGMDEKLGLSTMGDRQLAACYDRVRARTNEILSEQLALAVAAIRENRSAMDALVGALLEKNHLKEDEIRCVIEANLKRS